MEIVLILVLVVVVILIVGYPLINPERYRDETVPASASNKYDDLYTERETTFEALRDLQFEYATGKLSQSDYEQLKGRYEVQAANILQQIDGLQTKSKTAEGTRACPRCKTTMSMQDKFCTKCGAKL
jgi:hypothetical protein